MTKIKNVQSVFYTYGLKRTARPGVDLLWYWLYLAVRTDWRREDPEIVSDVLFAIANVMSIARTTYLMRRSGPRPAPHTSEIARPT